MSTTASDVTGQTETSALEPKALPGADSGRWTAAERDDLLTLVRDPHGDEVLVEFNPQAWVCTTCGLFPIARARKSWQACIHIQAATRALPIATALRIASIVAQGRSAKARTAAPGVNEKAHDAVALAKSAITRTERNSSRDGQHLRIVGEVTTRRMTDEDVARLAERRRKKTIGE